MLTGFHETLVYVSQSTPDSGKWQRKYWSRAALVFIDWAEMIVERYLHIAELCGLDLC
jgi:hypothetical protein